MPFGLVFRKAIWWHNGTPIGLKRFQEIEVERDPSRLQWRFTALDAQGLPVEASIEAHVPGIHVLPYLKTDCSGTFPVSNASLANAGVRFGKNKNEILETIGGAVLELGEGHEAWHRVQIGTQNFTMTNTRSSGRWRRACWTYSKRSRASASWTWAAAPVTRPNKSPARRQVVGVKKSPEMIQQARAKYPSLKFEVMDAREIAFAEPFDAVFSNATLHWIKEPERAVAGIARALRPEGRFVAEFGGKGNVAGLTVATELAWHKVGLPGRAPSPWYYPSVGEYSTLLEKHGLEADVANLFDRPTALEDGARGLHNWLEMFGGAFLEQVAGRPARSHAFRN